MNHYELALANIILSVCFYIIFIAYAVYDQKKFERYKHMDNKRNKKHDLAIKGIKATYYIKRGK